MLIWTLKFDKKKAAFWVVMAALVIIGVMSMLFFHVFQNVAMGMGIMPITGIPLPFMSYGGSNFITNIAAIALVLNVTRGRSAATLNTLQSPSLN